MTSRNLSEITNGAFDPEAAVSRVTGLTGIPVERLAAGVESLANSGNIVNQLQQGVQDLASGARQLFDGSFDLNAALAGIAEPFASIFEAAGSNLQSARFPFVHPEDWIAKGRNFGIWTFETQRQYENFAYNKHMPFDDNSSGKWVFLRNNSTGGTVYGLYSIGTYWVQFSIQELISIQVLIASDQPARLNNLTRQPPTAQAPSQADPNAETPTTTLPAETSQPRTGTGIRIITSANLVAIDPATISPSRPTRPSYQSASGPSGITITDDNYGLSNVNGSGPTVLLDALGQQLILTPDTFLQGIQGGLSDVVSQIGGNLFNQFLGALPPGIQNFLNATGLTTQLQEGINNLFGGNRNNSASKALKGLTDSQKEAIELLKSEKMREIAKKVPGAITQFQRLQTALEKWNSAIENSIADPEVKKYFLDRAEKIANGQDPGPVDTAKLERLTAQGGVQFAENPAALLADIARAAEEVQNKISKEVNDNTFQKLGSSAAIASSELAQVFVKNDEGKWIFTLTPEEYAAKPDFAFEVEDGVIVGE